MVIALDHPGTFVAGLSKARVEYTPNTPSPGVTVSVIGRSDISNGDFSQGAWGPLGDCDAQRPTQARPTLTASVEPNRAPGGAPALRLAASLDSACVQHAIDWHGGTLILSMMINHVQGSDPRVCIWETGPDRCATAVLSAPTREPTTGSLCCSFPISGNGWSTYRASVKPDVGTATLAIYLYADASQEVRTISEYANVRVIELPALSSFALLADPPPQPPASAELAIVHNTFSNEWEASARGEHVLVDGMLNGWLVATGTQSFAAAYRPDLLFLSAQWLSLGGWLIIALASVVPWILSLRRLRHPGRAI
jgi:hypothetical protein